MPVEFKQKRRKAKATGHDNDLAAAADEGNDEPEGSAGTITVFVYRPLWFVLSQTDGDPYVPTELPAWSEARSLHGLGIERIAFTHTNGNCQGFARQRQVSVSPIAVLPHTTLFHELAHVVLGHTVEGPLDDHDRTPKSLREVEAECVALIVSESLNLPGAAECRGYIQHWLKGEKIPDRNVQRIFKTADAILKAGYPPKPSK